MTSATPSEGPKVGARVTFRKTMTVAEQAMFTGISGNLGGLYVDRTWACAAGLADMAVFEMAASSLLSTCLARLAGPGFRIGAVSLAFDRAIPVGANIEATATVSGRQGASFVCALSMTADGAAYTAGEARLEPV
ncbi:MaoC/PaaZ C-terminal domain-containing protein [Chelativorans xinjiangense]|uniref:MaoC/PaaZ C-terminal domain-containing protein n=1 Tax=Chelativorans xinjiangense TaxID=2681485 RepID=UPI0013569C0D|nr:MaoC/PaaZ C-terminal domain-containing protein [Chelativorans xinjiangense]